MLTDIRDWFWLAKLKIETFICLNYSPGELTTYVLLLLILFVSVLNLVGV